MIHINYNNNNNNIKKQLKYLIEWLFKKCLKIKFIAFQISYNGFNDFVEMIGICNFFSMLSHLLHWNCDAYNDINPTIVPTFIPTSMPIYSPINQPVMFVYYLLKTIKTAQKYMFVFFV